MVAPVLRKYNLLSSVAGSFHECLPGRYSPAWFEPLPSSSLDCYRAELGWQLVRCACRNARRVWRVPNVKRVLLVLVATLLTVGFGVPPLFHSRVAANEGSAIS